MIKSNHRMSFIMSEIMALANFQIRRGGFVRSCILKWVLDDVTKISRNVQMPRLLFMLTVLLIAILVLVVNIVIASVDCNISNNVLLIEIFGFAIILILFSLYILQYAIKTPYIKCYVDNNIRKAKVRGDIEKFKENVGIGKDTLSMTTAINALLLTFLRETTSFLKPTLIEGNYVSVQQMERILKAFDVVLIAVFLAILIMVVVPNIIMYSLYNSEMVAYANWEKIADEYKISINAEVQGKAECNFLKSISGYLINAKFWVAIMLFVVFLSLLSVSINDAIFKLWKILQTMFNCIYEKVESTGNGCYVAVCILGILFSKFYKK